MDELLSAELEPRFWCVQVPGRLVAIHYHPGLGHLRRQHMSVSKLVGMLFAVLAYPRPVRIRTKARYGDDAAMIKSMFLELVSTLTQFQHHQLRRSPVQGILS